MLQSIREKIQGIIAGVIIAFLCLTFAVWGIESYLNEARKVVVAEVNDDEVELAEYQETFQRLRQRAQAELGDSFDPAVWGEAAAKQRVLDFVVDDKVLGQALDSSRIRVGVDQVAEFLRSSPNFQVDGKFSTERYAQVTSMLGFTPQAFEAQAQRDLALEQLRTGVVASAFITSSEFDQVSRLQAQTRTIGLVTLQPASTSAQEVSGADLETYFKSHAEEFRIPDQVALEYAEIRLENLMKEVTLAEGDMVAHYDSHQADFTVEEQRAASHILVQVKADASAEAVAKAKARAEELRGMVTGGKDFADIAREFSDDIGSRAEGGATGLFGKGVMAPEFEQAVFSMKTGDISEPIKTDFGYHVIRLTEIKPEAVTAYAEVRGEIEQRLRREKAEEMYFEAAERFSETIYEYPDSLADAAGQLGLEVQSTSKQGREQIVAQFNAAVADAVWEPEVLTQGLVSAPVEVGDERIVAVRVTQYEPSRLPDLATVKDEVSERILTERSHQQVKERGEALLAKLRAGESPEKLMTAEKLEWELVENAKRDDTRLNRAVLRGAFRASLPKPEDRAQLGVEFGDGSYAVIEVSNAQTPEALQEADSAATGRIREGLARARALTAWRDFVTGLRADARVELHPDRL
jgi:peptidyl-prolyl cis-trans isomerase D